MKWICQYDKETKEATRKRTERKRSEEEKYQEVSEETTLSCNKAKKYKRERKKYQKRENKNKMEKV
jgi:hypothetical protein